MDNQNDPDIIFNENGVCNHCLNYQKEENKLPKTEKERTAQFERQIAEIKKNGVGKKYDAILGVSGGVDSTYLAWLCKENGLRVL